MASERNYYQIGSDDSGSFSSIHREENLYENLLVHDKEDNKIHNTSKSSCFRLFSSNRSGKGQFSRKWYILLVIWLTFMGFMIAGGYHIVINLLAESPRPEPDYSKYSNVIDISLLGDSLINKPFSMFNLAYEIRSRLISLDSNTIVKFDNYGVNGQAISQIRKRLDGVLKTKPAGLILYWDSNMDHLDESTMTNDEIETYRKNYINDIRYIIESTRGNGTYFITLMGPGTYSEGPCFVPLDNRKKSPMLDIYRDINANVCADLSVPYSDIREVFINSVPWYWPWSRWYVTLDGEHPNKRGTGLVAQLFAKHINDWLLKTNYIRSSSRSHETS